MRSLRPSPAVIANAHDSSPRHRALLPTPLRSGEDQPSPQPGEQDDLAVITGIETFNNGVGIWHVTVDPVAEGLPDYTAIAISAAHETLN